MKACRIFAVFAISFFAFQPISSAGTIVLGESKVFSPPAVASQTTIEFYLDRTAADDGSPLSVGNFQVRVLLTGAGAGSTVRILGAGPTTTRPQAFALDTTTVSADTSVYAATLNLAAPFNIADGAGLMKVNLEILPGASGNYALTVQSGSGNTEFTSPIDFSTLLPVDAGSGSVSVMVPEPAGLLTTLIAIGLATARRRWRA